MRATLEDKKALARLNLPADERYETSVRMRGIVLSRMWAWAQRVNATEDEMNRISDSLGLNDPVVIREACEYSAKSCD